MPSRVVNQDELHEIIGEWVATMDSAAEVEAAIGHSTILVADVRNAAEIRDTPWAQERGAFVEVDLRPGTDPIAVPQSPWRFNKSQAGAVPRASFRGEDNRTVLSEVFGCTPDELDDLEADEVISDRVPDWRRPPAAD